MAEPHAEALADLDRRSSPDPWNAHQWVEEIQKPHGSAWVVLDAAGAPRGAISGWRVADEMQVANVVVDPDCRRQGLGKRLMDALEADARKFGLAKITLEVRTGNTSARALYRKLGFHTTGHRRRYYDDREDAMLMEKKITP